MVRRLGGVVLIVVACLLVAVVSGIHASTPSGTARLPLDAVVVGACIAPLGDPMDHQVSQGAGEGEENWITATYVYPQATMVDCSQQHAGVLLTVDYGSDPPDAATMPQIDAWDASCQQRVDTRLGAQGFGPMMDHLTGFSIDWNPALAIAGRTVGPSPEARSNGAEWSACAMVSSDGALGNEPDDPLPGQCLRVGTFADPASGSATSGPRIDDPAVKVSCLAPHVAQVIAIASVGREPGRGVLQRSCETAAAHFLRVPDADFGGEIGYTVIQNYNQGVCIARVAGPGKLDGSLLGLGRASLPWAS
jgi:hypothetical protein